MCKEATGIAQYLKGRKGAISTPTSEDRRDKTSYQNSEDHVLLRRQQEGTPFVKPDVTVQVGSSENK